MKQTVRTAARLAAIYQLLLLVHIALLVFAPGVNAGFMISIEALYALGWFGWCFHKELHEITGKAPYAGIIAVSLTALRLASIAADRLLDLPLTQQVRLELLIAAEAAFLSMVSILLVAWHNLPYEGPEL